jgi:hypothetical protein
MSAHQIERLYKKMIVYDDSSHEQGTIDARVRSEIFQKIMDDVEHLIKRLKRCKKGSQEFEAIGLQVRQLLLKEVQIIIDDYVMAQKNGTIDHWKTMYGNINDYIKNFYFYRRADFLTISSSLGSTCGFYDADE